MESWNAYWKNNHHGDCFSLDGQSELSQILSNYWCDYFRSKKQGLYLLDLACGNGFVGKCAIKSNSNLLAIGVDKVAEIGQTEFQVVKNNSRLKLLTGLGIDQLKFAENEFDIIVSQFGIEYSDFSSIIKNIVMQLKPNGEMHLVLHHTESILYQQSQTEITILNYLLSEIKIFESILKYAMQHDEHSKKKLLEIITLATKKGVVLADNNESVFFSIFNLIKNLVNQLISFNNVSQKEINYLQQHYLAHYLRLQQQISVSLDQYTLSKMLKVLSHCGMNNITHSKLENGSYGLIGWQVNSTKTIS